MLDYFSNVLDPLEFIEQINSTGGTEMSTAAHYAALRSQTEIFEILMTHEFDIWKPNLRGLRPFDISATTSRRSRYSTSRACVSNLSTTS